MRYANTAPGAFDVDQPFRKLPYNPIDTLSLEEVETKVFYPCFSRVTMRHHLYPSTQASGYTDKCLFSNPANRCVPSEGKTPWAYPTLILETILLGDPALLNQRNEFQKDRQYQSNASNALLKQVGIFHGHNMHTNNSPFAFPSFSANAPPLVQMLHLQPI